MTPIQVDVLRTFRKLGVRHLVVGGQAMRAMGINRQTRDLDLWIGRDIPNAKAMSKFLARAQHRPPLERLLQPNLKLSVGDPRNPEVDILNSLAGDPDFDECFMRALEIPLDGQQILIISGLDLLAVKEAAATIMDRDAADQSLTAADRVMAAATAEKERRDALCIRGVMNTSGQSG